MARLSVEVLTSGDEDDAAPTDSVEAVGTESVEATGALSRLIVSVTLSMGLLWAVRQYFDATWDANCVISATSRINCSRWPAW